MSIKFRITSLLASLLVLPLALMGSVPQPHAIASSMTEATTNMTSSQLSDCLSACGSQLQNSVTSINQLESEKEKELKPTPAEPYYLQYLQFAFVLVLISATFLLKHLLWRPPDFYKLNSVYRF